MHVRFESGFPRDLKRIGVRSAPGTALIGSLSGVLIVTMGVTPVSIALALISAALVRACSGMAK